MAAAGVSTMSTGDFAQRMRNFGGWMRRHPFKAILLFALLYNLGQHVRAQIYFMQDFQAMAPEERIGKFSWNMHIWRYRLDRLLVLWWPPDDQFPEGTYIREYFETFYPVGSPIEPFKAALKDITIKEGLPRSYCGEAKRKHLTKWGRKEYISQFLCEIKFRPYIFILPMYWQWSIRAEYNNKTGRILKYYGSFGSTGP